MVGNEFSRGYTPHDLIDLLQVDEGGTIWVKVLSPNVDEKVEIRICNTPLILAVRAICKVVDDHADKEIHHRPVAGDDEEDKEERRVGASAVPVRQLLARDGIRRAERAIRLGNVAVVHDVHPIVAEEDLPEG